jgi:hypothetical protein
MIDDCTRCHLPVRSIWARICVICWMLYLNALLVVGWCWCPYRLFSLWATPTHCGLLRALTIQTVPSFHISYASTARDRLSAAAVCVVSNSSTRAVSARAIIHFRSEGDSEAGRGERKRCDVKPPRCGSNSLSSSSSPSTTSPPLAAEPFFSSQTKQVRKNQQKTAKNVIVRTM